MTRKQTIDRSGVLDAAERLIAELGPAALTLDALAARTGVSKGGLQYAFKSKDGLIEAMVRRFVDQNTAGLAAVRQASTREERLVAWLESLLRFGVSGVHNALLAAVVQNPKLLGMAASTSRSQLAEVAGDDIPPERVIALSLAADGLMLGELLGLIRLSPAERSQVAGEILELARISGKRPAIDPDAPSGPASNAARAP